MLPQEAGGTQGVTLVGRLEEAIGDQFVVSRLNFCLIYPLYLLKRICLHCVCNCLSSTHRLLLVPF